MKGYPHGLWTYYWSENLAQGWPWLAVAVAALVAVLVVPVPLVCRP